MERKYQYVGSGKPVSLGVLLASQDVERDTVVDLYDASGEPMASGPWYEDVRDFVDNKGHADQGYATLEREGVIRFQLDPALWD